MGKRSGQRGLNTSVACVLALGALGAGCSSSYKPVGSPRASLVMDEGSPHVVRDGVDQGGFMFGGGVVDAVQTNPRALKEARTGRNLVVGGFVVTLVGVGVAVGGLAYGVSHESDDRLGTGLGIALGGLAVELAGVVITLNGQPYLYDALNIYNDELEANRPPAYPPGAPSFPRSPALQSPSALPPDLPPPPAPPGS
jgi:hypothetical protein